MSQEIQRNITGIFNELDRYSASKDLREIHYWSNRCGFQTNDEYQRLIAQLERLIKLTIKNLNMLTESVDDLEIKINQCKRLITLETQKNPSFAVRHVKYHNNRRLGGRL